VTRMERWLRDVPVIGSLLLPLKCLMPHRVVKASCSDNEVSLRGTTLVIPFKKKCCAVIKKKKKHLHVEIIA